MLAYRGSHDLIGPWKFGTDTTAHQRLVQGNANYFKDSLATRLAIVNPGPGYLHFDSSPVAGFDEEFFLQLLSERKEKRKRLGTITTRWVQTRERNEALDLVCMVLCALETYRGMLDSMEPQIVTTDKEQAQSAPKWGAQKFTGSDAGIGIGGVVGFGTDLHHARSEPLASASCPVQASISNGSLLRGAVAQQQAEFRPSQLCCP